MSLSLFFPLEDPGPGHKINRNVISPKVKLAITLRTLVGAERLDLRWPYNVGWSSCYTLVGGTFERIWKNVDNTHFPTTPDKCRKAAKGFQLLRNSPLWSVVAALDGLSMAIRRPSKKETDVPKFFYIWKGFIFLARASSLCC